MKKVNLTKLKPFLPYVYVVGGIAVGCLVSFVYNNSLELPIENILPYPSTYSENYKKYVGDYITDKKSPFIVLNEDYENVSLEAPFVRALQEFSTKYIDTLSSNNPEYDLKDFYLKKSDDSYDLIANDLSVNEPLYMMEKDNVKVIAKEEGFISPDGNNATLKVVFEFTVKDILVKNDMTALFKEGKTYKQERELSLKRTNDGTFKIYETFIMTPEEVTANKVTK